MTQNFIIIKGQTYDPSELTLPISRDLRDFWEVNGSVVEIDTNAALEHLRSNATIDRGTFALACAKEGWITESEALSWASGQSIPSWVEDIIDNEIPSEERLRIKIEVLTNQNFTRYGMLMPLLQSAPQTNGTATDEKIDEIYNIQMS